MKLRTRKRHHPIRWAPSAAELHESKPSPVLRKRTTAVWISFAAVGAAAAIYAATRPDFARWVGQLHISAPSAHLQHEDRPTAPVWIASAPGRVEPSSGEVRIDAVTVGRVAEVEDRVQAQGGEESGVLVGGVREVPAAEQDPVTHSAAPWNVRFAVM